MVHMVYALQDLPQPDTPLGGGTFRTYCVDSMLRVLLGAAGPVRAQVLDYPRLLLGLGNPARAEIRDA
jgi:hypothetical protein